MHRAHDEGSRSDQRRGNRDSRDRRSNWPRDGVRKVALPSSIITASSELQQSFKRDTQEIFTQLRLSEISDWLHDKFEDNPNSRNSRGYRQERNARNSPESQHENGIKIRVDNLHYDLTEEDLKELFSRIGHVLSVNLLYDRQDRSKGIAFVQYARESDARLAIREFDGANAHGQPIRLTQMPSKQPQQPSRNPFDHVEGPSRSLFERVDSSNINRNVVNTRRNHRSASPDDDDSDYRNRRSNVTKPPPDHIDRYVPDRRNARSPMPRIGGGGGGGRDGGRRPGARRDNSVRKDAAGGGGGGVGRDGRRPKKTSDDLDAEMADYWGDKGNNAGMNGTGNDQVVNAGTGFGGQERDVEVEEDVDMIE